MRLATGPVTWGVDFADAPANPPWPHVLDEIAASGIGALELGPVGYLPEDADTLRAALASRGLEAVGAFVFEDLHTRANADTVLATARRACAAIRAAGGTVLTIIDRPDGERAATAGRPAAAPRLDGGTWRAMMALISAVAAVAAQHGLAPVVHPHAGSRLEFEDEIERVLEDTTAGLCIDTAHLAYAGLRAESVIARYAGRIRHVHFKDLDGAVLDRARSEALTFWDAVAAGVFCPIGRGSVAFPAVVDALEAIGYDGYATIEQDRVPGAGSPLDDLASSVAALTAAGVR